MQTRPFAATPRPAGRPGGPPANESDRAFIGMLDAYRSSGGLARAQEVFTLFKGQSHRGVATLAQWIAQRHVLSLEWHADVWLPLFQFERRSMDVKSGLEPVLAALNPIFTPWEVAHWCAQPNRWLGDCAPADHLDADGQAVLRAACAERFCLPVSLSPGSPP